METNKRFDFSEEGRLAFFNNTELRETFVIILPDGTANVDQLEERKEELLAQFGPGSIDIFPLNDREMTIGVVTEYYDRYFIQMADRDLMESVGL